MRRPSDVLKAGTRTSPLALVQTKDVLRRLAESFGVRAEIVELSSPGDRDKTSDLRASAPDFFTKDIDEALLSGAIDFAIHSAKDMPETTPAGLDYLWLRPWSEDPRDVIILRQGEVMPRPEAKIRIGVSSARREAYCRERFPDASLEPLRGNIGERLAQLDEGRFDLLILAAAGLSRLGLAGRISEFIPLEKLEAPAGQGVLALAFREGDRLFNALRLAFVKPVIFAGAGPGPKELSTIATAKALSRCEICLYDSLVDESALSLLPPAAKAISVGKRMGRHSVPQTEICRALVDFARQGFRVVRLKGGDPGIFGRLAEETEALDGYELPFETIPGVSSMNAATTRTGLLLTRRQAARGFTVMTPRKAGSAEFEMAPPEERAKFPLAVFMGASETARLCESLIAEGRAPSTPAALVYAAGSDAERAVAGSLESLPKLAAEANPEGSPGLFLAGEIFSSERLFKKRGALAGKHVLLCCSEALLEKAANAARDYGAIPVEFNMTRLTPEKLPSDFAGRLAKADWLVCSSPGSAEILLSSVDPRRLPKLISCGPGTSAVFLARGIAPEAEAAAPYGAEAMIEVAKRLLKPGGKVVRVRSDLAGETLGKSLSELGAQVEDVVLYRAESVRREKLPAFEMAFFSSASELRAFHDSFGSQALEGKVCAVLGGPAEAEFKRLYPALEVLVAEAAKAELAIEALARRALAAIIQAIQERR